MRSRLSTALILSLLAYAPAVEADSVSSRSGSALFQSQLSVLDGRASQQYSNSSRLLPPKAEAEFAENLLYLGAYRGPFLQMAREAARRHDVPEGLFLRLVEQESRWNPDAVSAKGAIGLAQLMPGTARIIGVDPNDPHANLHGGARYLRRQFDAFGSWKLALAAYNAGPEAVRSYSGIPPYAETQGYVRKIWGS